MAKAPRKIVQMIPHNAKGPEDYKYVSKDTKLSMASKKWVADIAEAGRFPAGEAERAVESLRKLSSRTTYLLLDAPEETA